MPEFTRLDRAMAIIVTGKIALTAATATAPTTWPRKIASITFCSPESIITTMIGSAVRRKSGPRGALRKALDDIHGLLLRRSPLNGGLPCPVGEGMICRARPDFTMGGGPAGGWGPAPKAGVATRAGPVNGAGVRQRGLSHGALCAYIHALTRAIRGTTP